MMIKINYPKGSIQHFLLKKLKELEDRLNKLEKEYYGTLYSKR